MHCPFCRNPDSRVTDSRTSEDGTVVRRRRQCTDCGQRFSTTESATLMVAKRSGVVESFNRRTGLGSRFGTWLLERGLAPKFGAMGTCRLGQGGLAEQIPFQGMGREDITAKIRALIG